MSRSFLHVMGWNLLVVLAVLFFFLFAPAHVPRAVAVYVFLSLVVLGIAWLIRVFVAHFENEEIW